MAPKAEPKAPRVVLQEQKVIICLHCWTADKLYREYPMLKGMPISSDTCDYHFDALVNK